MAVTFGRILKLFQSKAGGITIYQLSGDEKFIYYYAHLDRYADGLIRLRKDARADLLGLREDRGGGGMDDQTGNDHRCAE